MARPLRIQFPGALYHVLNRGNAGGDIVLDDADRRRFLALLAEAVARHGWRCHAYCLMDNHYHLLLATPEANLGRGMQWLSSTYSRKFNWRHQRYGHVFQGRYKAILVDEDAYLLELARYIALNPVRAGVAAEPANWPWSSYGATVGAVSVPAILDTGWLLSQFGPDGTDRARAFAAFVAEGLAQPRDLAAEVRQGILGGPAFRRRLLGQLKGPSAGALAVDVGPRASLAELAEGAPCRGEWMSKARREHGYRLGEIAAFAGLSKSSVSKIIKAWESA